MLDTCLFNFIYISELTVSASGEFLFACSICWRVTASGKGKAIGFDGHLLLWFECILEFYSPCCFLHLCKYWHFWDIQISSQCGPRTPSPPRSQIHDPVPLEAGDVERLKVLKNPDGTTKGVGFVTFRTEEQADSAESWHTGWHSVDSVAPMLFATVVSIMFIYVSYLYLFSLSLFVCMTFTCIYI